ncbi:hypothetical protein C5615_20070 [Burkholderia cepacia]|uniref:Uncharacterized protein n=1 Tax=Burkholderia cepacia TaxID=292 RepID=A0A2S8INL9_BURCE|nr:hypothetical protein [Burkholderia cepacia]PQP16285.1 hypothetical protein C5615_20070 [Burkholderia cepacia]HDR9508561.1 hypothetical protein [Burkholderia cepacia]
MDATLTRAARAARAFAVDGDHFIGRHLIEPSHPVNETGFELRRIECREFPTERIVRWDPRFSGTYRRIQSNSDSPPIWIATRLTASDSIRLQLHVCRRIPNVWSGHVNTGTTPVI